MKIKINTIDTVKDFVNICNSYVNSDIDVSQGKYMVDGKSILGIFSLNLVDPIDVIIGSEDENLRTGFYNSIQKWAV